MQNDGVRIGLRLLKPETVRRLRRELQRGVPEGPLPHSYPSTIPQLLHEYLQVEDPQVAKKKLIQALQAP